MQKITEDSALRGDISRKFQHASRAFFKIPTEIVKIGEINKPIIGKKIIFKPQELQQYITSKN